MEFLPTELFNDICCYLELRDRVHLRMTSKGVLYKVSEIPIFHYEEYKRITTHYGRILRDKHRIRLENKDWSTESMFYLIENRHSHEFCRLFKLKGHFISAEAKQKAFLQIVGNNLVPEMTSVLIMDGNFDPNLEIYSGRTALMLACLREHAELVKLLLNDERTNVHLIDKSGWNAVHYSCLGTTSTCLKLLLNDGRANPCIPDYYNDQPIHCAVKFGKSENVKLLLRDKRVNPNICSHNGTTPLHYAAYLGRKLIVQILLEDPRVEIDVVDYDGKTADDLASNSINVSPSSSFILVMIQNVRNKK